MRACKYPPKSPKYLQYSIYIYNAEFARKIDEIRNKEEPRAIVELASDSVILKKNDQGNLLTPYVKSQYVALSLGTLISEPLKRELAKKCVATRIRVKIFPREWGMSDQDFFTETLHNRQLAQVLLERGLRVTQLTSNDVQRIEYGAADLLIHLDSTPPILIEITSHLPSKNPKTIRQGVNAPHGSTWAKISGRVLPLLVYGLEYSVPTFVVINRAWQNTPHAKWLERHLQNQRCNLIFTDFGNNWAIEVADKIYNFLMGGKAGTN